MDNQKIAEIFDEIGDILDIQGAGFFRVNAYRKAALIISNLAMDLRKEVKKDPDNMTKIPGVGDSLHDKIVELVQTGKCQFHEDLKKDFPMGLLEVLALRGLGPKKVKSLHEKLGIVDIKSLKEAATSGKIHELEGMGKKTEEEILKAIEEHAKFSPDRHFIHEALQEAEAIIDYIKALKEVIRIEYAGSLRRWQETIGDIDILVTVDDERPEVHKKIMGHFVKYDEVMNVLSEGDTKSSVLLQSGIQVDLRVVDNDSFGAALHYFTGDKAHNIRVRDIAKKQGLKINEYGVFEGEKKIAAKEESELFATIGLPFIIPELRRDDGEVDYGLNHKSLPKFVELSDIKGDLHCHSFYSDGKNTIEEMAEGFVSRGYEYFAMTDHSAVVGITQGMREKEIREQSNEIDALNKKFAGKIIILKGVEVDILKDGELDFEQSILTDLDIVVISAHLFTRLDEAAQTKRLIKAIENSAAKILGHPTGRLINKRAEMKFDMNKIIDACVSNKVAMEINANPFRLDLAEKYIKMAKSKGAKFVINTDSHSLGNQEFMKFGVGMARRGWLESSDILNTESWKKFDNYFQGGKMK